ncbi:hypothetical protein OUZ56_028286 [Daphnia magna]|uniref:Uncharacterized protein n=1 Tax=Daphnia magna TaxID=35525 RepID=A0ABR0B3E2_9CRUS|nr:hypothetical protein OUZ56_028286 [Daphnia magna]
MAADLTKRTEEPHRNRSVSGGPEPIATDRPFFGSWWLGASNKQPFFKMTVGRSGMPIKTSPAYPF